jgi:hypothetical protein
MSLHKLEIMHLEESLARNRLQASASVTELADRLRPANLLNVAIDSVAGKAASVTNEALKAAKTHAGKATVFGAGALLAFDIGRLAGQPSDRTSGQDQPGVQARDDENRTNFAHSPKKPSKAIDLGAFSYWAGGLAAVAFGYGLGKFIPISEAEKQLVGGMPSEFKIAANEFWNEHAHGAKLAAVGSFGVARWFALGLGLMAAAAKAVQPRSSNSG